MQSRQHQSHYEPASVGGLMETDFLRDVAHGTEGQHRLDSFPEKVEPQWRHMMEALTNLFRRR